MMKSYTIEDMDTEQEKTTPSSNRRWYWWGGPVYGGAFLLVVGIIFLLNNFGYFHGDAWGKLWPLFIITTGLFMMLSPWRKRRG
jgi:hypothetical protein